MKWIASLSLFLALTGGALAAGIDDQYLDILGQILQADALQDSGHLDAAAPKYLDARNALQKLHADHPTWNGDVVNYRLEYLSDKLKDLAKYVPAVATTTAPVAAIPATPQQQVMALQAQIDTLTAANLQLEEKIKEALSVQPAAVAPGELAKARQQNIDLQKQRDLLIVALAEAKAKATNAPAIAPVPVPATKVADQLAAVKKQAAKEAAAADAEITEIKHQLADSQKKLAAATALANSSKTAPSADEVKKLAGQRDKLTDELAMLRTQSGKDAGAAKSQITDLQHQLDTSRKELAAATAEVTTLKARPSVDDAAKVTRDRDKLADELAALKTQSGKDASAAKTQIADLQRQLADSKKMLADATAAKPRSSTEDVSALTSERDKLKKDLAAANRELADREAHAAVASPDAAKLKQVEQQRDALEKQVAALSHSTTSGAGTSTALADENKGLRAQLAVLEASPVPLTTQEIAMLDSKPGTNAAAKIPSSSMEVTHQAHSKRDLPAGVGGLMANALRAAAQGDYPTAEKQFLEVLAQDPDNVYVLVNLGDTQFAEGHLDDCEKNVQRALALDSQDPGVLYLLGILRFRQNKLDDALDALSRSSVINSTNSSTQNYLGIVLFSKGLPAKAETALRNALVIDPLYADAHYNLALVYANEQPPSIALAKFHYQRAVALGHAKNSDLEKKLAGSGTP
jgi:Tfp pilus assembly protein PilF